MKRIGFLAALALLLAAACPALAQSSTGGYPNEFVYSAQYLAGENPNNAVLVSNLPRPITTAVYTNSWDFPGFPIYSIAIAAFKP